MLEKYEQTLEKWIESIVTEGDDDALFASGYLQGHVAVVFSQLEEQDVYGYQALEEKMSACLALARKELEDKDFALVERAWLDLSQRLQA